jgi:hypothetical protein
VLTAVTYSLAQRTARTRIQFDKLGYYGICLLLGQLKPCRYLIPAFVGKIIAK